MGMFKKAQKKDKLTPNFTVQDTIPFVSILEKEGIIMTSPNHYSKSYLLHDINYQIAKENEQEEMYIRYGNFLNSFEQDVRIQITINNRNVNQDTFEKDTLLRQTGDELDYLREEYNQMLLDKMSEGKNNMKRDKYLTLSIYAENDNEAITTFNRIAGEMTINLKRVGGAEATPINGIERLRILHDIYNLGHESEFAASARINGETVNSCNFKTLYEMGASPKDLISPTSFDFSKKDSFMVGDKYARVLYLHELPAILGDNILSDLTDTNCNMLTTLNIEAVEQDKALKLVSTQATNIRANVIEAQKRAAKGGYDGSMISPTLKKSSEEAEELLSDLTGRNQKMFLTTLVITHFADDMDQLNQDTELITSIGRKHLCQIKKLNYQQEIGFNSCLPLGINKIAVKRTLTTESTAIFMPFNSQELTQKNGMYYGLNSVSHNLILYNRTNGQNYNGFILGTPGAGKSFSAKREMLNVLLNTNDDVIIIDPEREYGPMAELLGGQVIKVSAGGNVHINPMDMDDNYSDDEDPVVLKSDFILSLCETVIGGRYGLTATQHAIIDRCIRRVYKDFERLDKTPTLLDFQEVLENQSEPAAKEIAIALELYTKGSLNIFAQPTNVKTKSRFIVYDVKDIGGNLKTMAMLIILDNIWNQLCRNRAENKKSRKFTWIYIDEIYLLFQQESSAAFLQQLYKRARKYGGAPTGITQNVEDLLMNPTARSMLSNCNFIEMLNQAPLDRAELAHLLNISPTQLSYITNADAGQGLLYIAASQSTPGCIVPFNDQFPKDTAMFKAMNTQLAAAKANSED